VLHEALTAGPDPLHLALVFNLSHATASRYAAIAQHLLDGQLEQPDGLDGPMIIVQQHGGAGRPKERRCAERS
jgi:hypothetical protein